MLQGAATARNFAISAGLSKEDHLVVGEFESESTRDRFLQALNLFILELDDSIALDADHVVMVLTRLFGFVTRLIVTKSTRCGEVAFGQ